MMFPQNDMTSEQMSYISDNMSAYDAQGQSHNVSHNGHVHWANNPQSREPNTASPSASYFGNQTP